VSLIFSFPSQLAKNSSTFAQWGHPAPQKYSWPSGAERDKTSGWGWLEVSFELKIATPPTRTTKTKMIEMIGMCFINNNTIILNYELQVVFLRQAIV